MFDTFSRRVSFKNIRSKFANSNFLFCAIASVPKMTNHRLLNVDSIVSNMKVELNDVGDGINEKAKSPVAPVVVAAAAASGGGGGHSRRKQMAAAAVKPVSATVSYESDILFAVTSLTKRALDMVTDMTIKVKKSSTLRLATRTTQPMHAAAIILVTILSMIFFPADSKQSNLLASRFTHLIYFTAFSLHAGSQFWMTFVSGLSLYFNLARHAFGDVQKILFPRYFTMNCVLSAITVIQFARLNASSLIELDLHTLLQVITLTLCFMVEFVIRIYFVPSVLKLISMKTMIEKAAGIGQEVGRYDLGPLLECPHYMSIHRSFRQVHMLTAIGNIVAIMCSAFHLYFLAYKWTIRAL